jgi:hypothetical protein
MADESTALVPVQERTVEFYGDEVLAALVEEQGERQVYVPVRPLCEYLGLAWGSQRNRLRRDDVLSQVVKGVFITNTPGGRQEMLCLPLEFLPGWLFGLDASRVRPELRDKIRRYRLECFRVLWRAFQAEALTGRSAPSSTLAQVRSMGLAIAELAEQQMALEGRVNQVEARVDARLDRAAEAFRALDRRMGAVEAKVTPGAVIGDEQAAEISARVKALAEMLTAQDASKNHYQSVFAELYRRFGVSSYKLIRRDQFEAVVGFLEEWRKAAG